MNSIPKLTTNNIVNTNVKESKIHNKIKTAIPAPLLNAIWTGSSVLKLPGFKASTKRANNTQNPPDLSHLGMDYFENEIYDTLARGLAFIDKDILKS